MAGIARIVLAVLSAWISPAQIGHAQSASPLFSDPAEIVFYTEIETLRLGGEYDRAEALLIDAFLSRPNDALEIRIAWLETLARVQLAAGKPGDAGDSRINQAQLLGRLLGPDSPELVTVYRAAGEAYALAGQIDAALDAYETALELARRYLPCDGSALGQLFEALSEVQRNAGQTREAALSSALAGDAAARCASTGQTRGLGDPTATPDPEGDYTLVEIAYATDRAPTGAAEPEDYYGYERAGLSYGRAIVSIPLSHKPGAVEASSLFRFEWEANPSRHVVLMEIEPLDEMGLFGLIGSRIESSDDGLFVFVHGYNVGFAKGAKRTAQMAYDMNFTGLPIYFSWPSRGSPGAYVADSAAVEYSARHLLAFLRNLVERGGGRPIHLVGHSMGNRALVDALELFGLAHDGAPVFSQIIFAAPDVDADVFAQQISTIAPLAERLTLYTSDADLALTTSRKLHGGIARAGQGGADVLISEPVETVDMSTIGSDVLRHSYFAGESSALADILWLFRRNAPPEDRCGMEEAAKPEGPYWIFYAEECNGGAILSALTLVHEFGSGALAEIERRVRGLADEGAIAELAQVRAMLEDILNP